MSKVTSKLQVSIPKVLADKFGIRPGDDLEWESADQALRVRLAAKAQRGLSRADRVAFFDAATKRQVQREAARPPSKATKRGWTRNELYTRG